MDFRFADISVNRFAENIWPDHGPVETLPVFDSFGARLRWWREKRGYGRGKQGKFATELKIKQGSLSELETRPNAAPSAEVLLRACAVLGLRPQYLLFGEGAAEGLAFTELSGPEAQLVMLYRALPESAKVAALIDANNWGRKPASPTSPTDPGKRKKKELA